MTSPPPQMSPEEISSAAKYMVACGGSHLPTSLTSADSPFLSDLSALVTRYVKESSLSLVSPSEWSIITDPDIVLINGRVSSSGHPTLVYNRIHHTLDEVNAERCFIISELLRKQRPCTRASFQARTNDAFVSNCSGDDCDQWPHLPLKEWLSVERLTAASRKQSWVEYFHSVTCSDTPVIGDGDGEVVEMRLSELLLMFLKAGASKRKAWPIVREDGAWMLPKMIGNGGKDEHVFLDLSEDVVVRVV